MWEFNCFKIFSNFTKKCKCKRTCMNCIHEIAKNITLLELCHLEREYKIGFIYTIKQIPNFNCSFVHFIYLLVIEIIPICKTTKKDFDKYLFLTHMISKHVWSAGPYAYTHTVRPYAYGRTVRVYAYGPDRTRTVQILIWSGTYLYDRFY